MSQPLIFITGTTGFIGAHVLTQALSAGYRVRLSVRKESQIASLKQLSSAHSANVEFVVIPDLVAPNAFDKVLEGASYIFHIASPMPGKGTDFKTTYLAPAKDGALAILNAAKAVSGVKRVVVVSSALALMSWEEFSAGTGHVVEGRASKIFVDADADFPDHPGMKYHASKLLAHQATLDWVAKNDPPFSVITLHPSLVYGRNLTQTSAEGIDGTNAMLLGSLQSERPMMPMLSVDVRDVALAHLRALNVKVVGNDEVHEFLLSADREEGWTWDNVKRFVKEKFPQIDVQLKEGFGDATSDTTKAKEQLGIKWRSMEDTVGYLLEQQISLRAKA